MSTPSFDSDEWFELIKTSLKERRQGDVFRDVSFVHLADAARPGTPLARKSAAKTGLKLLESTAPGLVVISQTCDLVAKSAKEAPFVDVALLIELPPPESKRARAGDRPRYAHLPRLGPNHFADLDAVMTVEKGVLYERGVERGVEGPAEEEAFGNAVGRKFSRFAFPDDLAESMSDLQSRFRKRHDSPNSADGKAMRQILQVRALANPGWDSTARASVEVSLQFILPRGLLSSPEELLPVSQQTRSLFNVERDPGFVASKLAAAEAEAKAKAKALAAGSTGDVDFLWAQLAKAWARTCDPKGRIGKVFGELLDAGEMSVHEYWRSQRVDLDYLSSPQVPD